MNLKDFARRIRRVMSPGKPEPAAIAADAYARRAAMETQFFSGCPDAHELPPIYHYWSNKFLRPKLEQLGFSHPEAMFCHYLDLGYVGSPNAQRTFASVGSGACDTEVRLAEDLVRRGHHDFTIECLEFNPELLERGQSLAREKGVAPQIVPVLGDFNKWVPTKIYDGVVANSSLHHVVNLEGLLSEIKRSLAPTGYFVTSDTIGRNGHLRWPEALSIVHEYWRKLPREYTYNHLLKR
jgi:SAM-dependent methyltransferase